MVHWDILVPVEIWLATVAVTHFKQQHLAELNSKIKKAIFYSLKKKKSTKLLKREKCLVFIQPHCLWPMWLQNLSAPALNQWLLLENVKHHTCLDFQSYKSLRKSVTVFNTCWHNQRRLAKCLKLKDRSLLSNCGKVCVNRCAAACLWNAHNYDKHIKKQDTPSAAYTTSGWWTPSQGQTSGHEQSIRQQSPDKVLPSPSTEKITRQPSNEDNTQISEHLRCLIRSTTLHPVTVGTNSPLAPMLPRHCHTQ